MDDSVSTGCTPGPVTLHTDALSANTWLGQEFWDDFHAYRVEWRAGDAGFIRWSLDGKVQFQLDAPILSAEREVDVGGRYP